MSTKTDILTLIGRKRLQNRLIKVKNILRLSINHKGHIEWTELNSTLI